MSDLSCAGFRAELERLLHPRRGRRPARGLTELSWSEHLLACAACRELLEAEEALDALLASLPAPSLPPALARRVLERLRREDARLDVLLALDAGDGPPARLAERVLAGVGAAREAHRLERLLVSVPEPEPPSDLPARVLAGLEAARRPRPARRARPRLVRRRAALSWAAGLFVALSLGVLAWAVRDRGEHGAGDAERSELARGPAPAPAAAPEPRTDPPRERATSAPAPPPAPPNAAPNAELLAQLDVLADDALWALLTGDDVDLVLGSLEMGDALLMVEDAADALGTDEGGTKREEEGPSKG